MKEWHKKHKHHMSSTSKCKCPKSQSLSWWLKVPTPQHPAGGITPFCMGWSCGQTLHTSINLILSFPLFTWLLILSIDLDDIFTESWSRKRDELPPKNSVSLMVSSTPKKTKNYDEIIRTRVTVIDYKNSHRW